LGRESERIALLFNHGAPMIAAVTAVLKSGNTYVPLDPHHPTERLSYILKDSQAVALVTDDAACSLANLLADGRIPTINIDDPSVKRSSGIIEDAATP